MPLLNWHHQKPNITTVEMFVLLLQWLYISLTVNLVICANIGYAILSAAWYTYRYLKHSWGFFVIKDLWWTCMHVSPLTFSHKILRTEEHCCKTKSTIYSQCQRPSVTPTVIFQHSCFQTTRKKAKILKL